MMLPVLLGLIDLIVLSPLVYTSGLTVEFKGGKCGITAWRNLAWTLKR